MMFTDADSAEDTTKSASPLANIVDDSCTVKYIEIVPLMGDTDGPCTTDSDSGDWSAQNKQENVPAVKQESEDDAVINASCCTTNDAGGVDETQCHMRLVGVVNRQHWARVKKRYNVAISAGSSSNDRHFTVRRKEQTGKRLYTCNQCGKHLSSQSGLYGHINIHTSKYQCTECGKRCQDNYTLSVHMRSHSGHKPYECPVCGKRFSRSGHLVLHSRIHSGEKPYKCYICDQAFCVSGALTDHIRVYTGDKPYKCSLCDKSFSRSSLVQSHERQVHSNRRPYLCTYCGMTFKTNGELKIHVRIHTGVKPYSCGQCSDHFRRLNQLKKHLLKAHNEGTWFICHICEKKFCDDRNFKKHVRRHERV